MINEFRMAIQLSGLHFADDIIPDGKLHRVHVQGQKAGSKNGWYVLYNDEVAAGAFGCCKLGISGKWSSKSVDNLTPEERDKLAFRMEAVRKGREAEEINLHTECREWCNAIMTKVADATQDHLYLREKGVGAHGIKQIQESLMIPLRDSAGIIHGVQFIMSDGTKKFKTGTVKLGKYYSIGKPKDKTILVSEGFATGATLHESTGHAVAVSFDAGNLKPVAKILREKFPEFVLIICADDDHLTEGNPGLSKAKEAAVAVNGVVAVPVFGLDRPDNATDFNDQARLYGKESVEACIDSANLQKEHGNQPHIEGSIPQLAEPTYSEKVKRLATLPAIEYERVRKIEARSLGVRTSALDQAVHELIKERDVNNDLPFKEVIIWPTHVDPAEILSAVSETVSRFIVCDAEISTAVTLWAAMTWFMDSIHVAPLAVITAPEKRCGKTQLLTLLGRLVCRPITASSISPAALFRAIDAWEPTLLIDEVDACMKDNEELRGIINSGHTRDSAYVIRTVGDTFTPTKFSTWGAKALSGIGHVADTLMDRAVILELRRKLSHESVDRLRYAEPGLFETLASKLARFAEDYSEQVRQARPFLPPSMNDRAQDNWEPLLAIAMVAGADWLDIATKTALKLSGGESEAQSVGTELLVDIREIFEGLTVDRISSADLIKSLCDDDEKPWATFNRGFPIKPRQLAGKLKGYGICSKTIRVNLNNTPKGYEKKQFDEAFSRYIPTSSPESATAPHTSNQEGSSVADGLQRCSNVAEKYSCNIPETLGCVVVADRSTPFGIGKTVRSSSFSSSVDNENSEVF